MNNCDCAFFPFPCIYCFITEYNVVSTHGFTIERTSVDRLIVETDAFSEYFEDI